MDLTIWRWSTAVQLSSAAMIAVFFAALVRSVRLANLRWWVLAWVLNVVGLSVAVSFWLVQPESPLALFVLRGLYMGAKTAFVVFLIQGAWQLKRPGSLLVRPVFALAGLALYTLVGALLVSGIDLLGVVQQGTVGVLFAVGTLLLLRRPIEGGILWLVTGFALRSVFGFVEVAAYAIELFPAHTFSAAVTARAATIEAVHSSFDSGTEWLIALGCVLALSQRTQRELQRYNTDLLEAQEELRQIADRDPLTALVNRRGLPAILRAVQPGGATLLFFDLDDFKAINDQHGHQVGDDCLKRFAGALRECFRPNDAIVRYAGDEFLVVAGALDAAAIESRVRRLRQRLRESEHFGPPIPFSVGIAELEPGGQPDAALEAADASMYRAKVARRSDRGRAHVPRRVV